MDATAAIQTADRTIELTIMSIRDIRDDEALLRVEAAGLSRSDQEIWNGSSAATGRVRYPLVGGHEPVGRIVRIGDRAARRWRVRVGDLVAVEPFCPCGACGECASGRHHLCRQRFCYGEGPADPEPGLCGAFADHMILRSDSLVHRIPAGVPADEAVLFGPLAAGFEWGYWAAGTQIGDTVLVLGPGQLGLACVIAVREAGAERIVVTGQSGDEHRLTVARELGATDVVILDEDDPVDRLREITSGAMADRVVDVTPHATQPVADALLAVRAGGTVVVAGLKHQAVRNFDIDRLHLRSVTLRGVSGVRSWSYQQALRVIASRAYPLHLVRTHRVALAHLAQGLRLLAGETAGEDVIHVTLVP